MTVPNHDLIYRGRIVEIKHEHNKADSRQLLSLIGIIRQAGPRFNRPLMQSNRYDIAPARAESDIDQRSANAGDGP
jgi:hypothetical protein